MKHLYSGDPDGDLCPKNSFQSSCFFLLGEDTPLTRHFECHMESCLLRILPWKKLVRKMLET